MARKKEAKAKVDSIEVYVSPSWKLVRLADGVKVEAPVCVLHEKKGLVKIKVSVEE